MKEFQVTLSLPVEADNVEDAVQEFRWDVANGPAYVYGVDDGENLVSFDAETGESTPAPRVDCDAVDRLAVKLYALAHETSEDDAVQSDADRQLVADIAERIREAFGLS